MIPDIFEISGEKVVVNENCLLIPELRAVYEYYKDPIPPLCFLHYKYSPKGPYCNIEEEEKDNVLLMDFPGEYSTEDDVMIEAMKKMDSFSVTPTYRYYLDNKQLLERLGRFARTATVTTGRDGNLGALLAQVRSVGKTISEFKILEKTVIQELNEMGGRVKGDKTLAYDQV